LEEKGAFYSGDYQNLLKQYGYSEKEIEVKINKTWDSLFFADDLKFYHQTDENMAYITDTGQ